MELHLPAPLGPLCDVSRFATVNMKTLNKESIKWSDEDYPLLHFSNELCPAMIDFASRHLIDKPLAAYRYGSSFNFKFYYLDILIFGSECRSA